MAERRMFAKTIIDGSPNKNNEISQSKNVCSMCKKK